MPNHAQMYSYDPNFLDPHPGKSTQCSIYRSGILHVKTWISMGAINECTGCWLSRPWAGESEVLPGVGAILKRAVSMSLQNGMSLRNPINWPIYPSLWWEKSSFSEYFINRLGASEVRAYHYKVRNENYVPGAAYIRHHAGPAVRPHVDVSTSFAPILFNWDLPELYQETLENGKHWQMVNIWRPLKLIRRYD